MRKLLRKFHNFLVVSINCSLGVKLCPFFRQQKLFTSHKTTLQSSLELLFVTTRELYSLRAPQSLEHVPSHQSTARRIFHKIQFHQVFIRRDGFGDGKFSAARLCWWMSFPHHPHRQSRSRKWDSALSEFSSGITLCHRVELCADSSGVSVRGISTRGFYSDSPPLRFHENFTVFPLKMT